MANYSINMEENLIYIGEAYLNRVKLALTGLDYLDGMKNEKSPELLAFEPFNRPLYELLYAAIVTGVEDYLRTRLKKEVSKSEESILSYLVKYNKINDGDEKRMISFQDGMPLSAELKDKVLETLEHHVYHKIDLIAAFFSAITPVRFPNDRLWKQMKGIIKMRHIIIHEGGKMPDGKHIEITPLLVHQALDISERFIQRIENTFYQNGYGFLYDIPDNE